MTHKCSGDSVRDKLRIEALETALAEARAENEGAERRIAELKRALEQAIEDRNRQMLIISRGGIELTRLRASLDVAEKYYEKLRDQPHLIQSEHPACDWIEQWCGPQKKPYYEFGPPRTRGWEGWYREHLELVREYAREALKSIREGR